MIVESLHRFSRPPFTNTAFAISLVIGACFFSPAGSSAQPVDTDYFPCLMLGLSTGYFNSSMTDFEKNTSQEPLFGLHTSIELAGLSRSTAVYGVFLYNHFVASVLGPDLIKWGQDYFNIGARLSLAQSFLDRPNAQLWIGAGLSRLRLSRKDFKSRSFLDFRSGRAQKITIDESIVEKWGSTDLYLEVGQMIPFEASNTPHFGLLWSIKYDRGEDRSLHFGGLSILLGLTFTAFYSGSD